MTIFYESDLEGALITHLQKFLLELGRAFPYSAATVEATFSILVSYISRSEEFINFTYLSVAIKANWRSKISK